MTSLCWETRRCTTSASDLGFILLLLFNSLLTDATLSAVVFSGGCFFRAFFRGGY